MKQNRRSFLSTASLLGVGLTLSCDNNTVNGKKKISQGITVTTWDINHEVNEVVWKAIEHKKSALDAVEAGAVFIENSINCCVGLGGNPDRDGRVTLDASIMDHKFNCGSVCYVQKIQNPISLARLVMEKTPHVMLVGDGAEKFAAEQGMKLVDPKLSGDAQKEYQIWLKKSEYKPQINIEQTQSTSVPAKLSNGDFNHDTMGILAIDNQGQVAGACTTSGMGFKMAGRVGDSPIIGSGLYVDGQIGAAVASGQGEEVIRVCGTHLVVEFMRQGMHPEQACKAVIERIISIDPEKAKKFQIGFIAINLAGEHGSYAIQDGFTYAVSDDQGLKSTVKSKFILSKAG